MTPQLLPNLTTGNPGQASQIMSTMGVPPVGNAGGSNTPGPTGVNALAAGTVNPVAGTGTGVMPAPGAITPVAGTSPPNLLTPGGPQGAIPTSQQQNSSQQLNSIFGKGVGGDIQDIINNLGSNDSSYMQAYTAAMAPQNAENLSTLNTTLGNSGVSANSSTAAIANADFQTGVTSQEGLQEAQLQQTDEQNLIGLVSGTESAANKEASTSVWGDIGSVLGSVGGAVGPALSALGDAGDL